MVNDVAAELDLPAKLRIHNAFHVSLLRKYTPTAHCKAMPIPEIIEGELEYEVENILDHRTSRNGTTFLIKWQGYPMEDNTWEPEKNLTNCHEILHAYKVRHKLA